jgi:hypothetical protein
MLKKSWLILFAEAAQLPFGTRARNLRDFLA